MRTHQIFFNSSGATLTITASTRAGIMAAALAGLAEACGLKIEASTNVTERPFSCSALDFPTLLVDFLNEAIAQGNAFHELCSEAKFTLITDKKAEGVLLGRPVASESGRIKKATHHELKVARNSEGVWEAVVVFEI